MKSVLIIGSNGNVGKYLFKKLKKNKFCVKGTTSKTSNTKDIIKINYKNTKLLKKIIKKFDCVIYCASESKFESCEKKTVKSKFLNVELITGILNIMNNKQKIIYFSSLGVKYKFKNKPIYIKQKEYIEKKIVEKLKNYFILRPSKIIDTINLYKYKKIYLDQKISITNLEIVFKSVLKILRRNLKGEANIASRNKITYFKLAKDKFKIKNINKAYSYQNNKFHFYEPEKYNLNKNFKFANKYINRII